MADERLLLNFNFKIMIIGDCNVGKTHIIDRYIYDKFELETEPIGCDISEKTILLKYNVIKSKIYDTTGIVKDLKTPPIDLSKINGVILAYDVTNRDSFNRINAWLNTLAEQNLNNECMPIMLVANKIDLARTVTAEEGQKLSNHFNTNYSEMSAKTNEGVHETFKSLATLMVKWQQRDKNGGISKELRISTENLDDTADTADTADEDFTCGCCVCCMAKCVYLCIYGSLCCCCCDKDGKLLIQ